MRITAPAPDARVDLAGIDFADPHLYAGGDAHLAWQTVRAERPVFRNPNPAPGFWVVTRHHDVRRVLRDHDTFTSERGIVLMSLGVPDPAAGKMVAVTDPPRHHELREPMGKPLSRLAVGAHAGWIRRLVRETVAPAWDCDVWDVATAFAPLPVAIVVRLMGLPHDDVHTLQRWAYAAVAPLDPHCRTGPGHGTLFRAHHEIMNYFRQRVRERCAVGSAVGFADQPDDLLGHLLTMEVAGRPMTTEEVIVNSYNLLLGGIVTASQAITAALVALAEQGGGVGRWPAGARSPAAVEEMLRWASPTMHFMRHARRDVELHDTVIRAGDAIVASIASANRDERVFADPYRFDPTRTPNPHIAFGGGVHYCVGQAVARLTIQIVIDEFFAKLDRFELAQPPVHLVSNLAAGMVRAPMRLTMRNGTGPAGPPDGGPGVVPQRGLTHIGLV